MQMLSKEAILYYKDRPVEFTEDIIKAKPDAIQAEIMQSVAHNSKTTVRSGHGIRKIYSGELDYSMVYLYKAISKNSLHSTYETPII